MACFSGLRDLDARGWRTATWSAPFVVQIELGLLLVVMWASGKWLFTTESGHGERIWMFAALAVTALMSLMFCGALVRSSSQRRRGLSLGIAGSSVIVVVGGAVYACLILR